MSVSMTATVTEQCSAAATDLYDLIADVTNMGRWSPECRSCEWLDEPGLVGSRFKGHNRRGPFRWTTTVHVLAAERGSEFSFATRFMGKIATRWTYRFVEGNPSTVTESFEARGTPRLIAFVARPLILSRRRALEDGMRHTLAALKVAAEA